MLNAFLEVLLFLLLAIHPSVSGLPRFGAIGLELGDLEAGSWCPGWFFTGHGLSELFASSSAADGFLVQQGALS